MSVKDRDIWGFFSYKISKLSSIYVAMCNSNLKIICNFFHTLSKNVTSCFSNSVNYETDLVCL